LVEAKSIGGFRKGGVKEKESAEKRTETKESDSSDAS